MSTETQGRKLTTLQQLAEDIKAHEIARAQKNQAESIMRKKVRAIAAALNTAKKTSAQVKDCEINGSKGMCIATIAPKTVDTWDAEQLWIHCKKDIKVFRKCVSLVVGPAVEAVGQTAVDSIRGTTKGELGLTIQFVKGA